MIRRTIALLLLLALPALSGTVSWSDLQKNIDSWIDSPAGLLLTSQEKDVYKKLKSPEDKMQFIKIFWQRRDPILRTSENEFKTEFYNRVEAANKEYAEGKTPGWKTARGQVFLLFGPPGRVDHRSVPDSSRPAELWVYDRIPSKEIPVNEALMFVYRDFKWVLMPPNAQPGDRIAEQQRQMDSNFHYQSIPSAVQQAFIDVRQKDIIDEKKNYDPLLFSVKSTEKFQIAEIPFEVKVGEAHQAELTIPKEGLPVYDDVTRTFSELSVKQELKQGDRVVATAEETVSHNWAASEFESLKELRAPLKRLEAPAGSYELWVTVQDRVSMVSETRKFPVTY